MDSVNGARGNDRVATEHLERMSALVTLTSDGQVTLLKNVGSAEHFVITCLVTQNLAYRLSMTPKQTLSVDEIIGAGGLAQRVARQTVYNTTSNLTKIRVIEKRGNEFLVSERTVLQFFATILPELLTRNS